MQICSKFRNNNSVKNLKTCKTLKLASKFFENQKDAAVCILPTYKIGYSQGGHLKRENFLTMKWFQNECSIPRIKISLILTDLKWESLQKLGSGEFSSHRLLSWNLAFAGSKWHPCTLNIAVQLKWRQKRFPLTWCPFCNKSRLMIIKESHSKYQHVIRHWHYLSNVIISPAGAIIIFSIKYFFVTKLF